MLDQSDETIYAGNGTEGLLLDDHESDTGNEEYFDEGTNNTVKSNLRQRKGKLIKCAKQTIESGKYYIFLL